MKQVYSTPMTMWDKFITPFPSQHYFKDSNDSNEQIRNRCREAIGVALRIHYHLPTNCKPDYIHRAKLEIESKIRHSTSLDDENLVLLIRRCWEYGINCEPKGGFKIPEDRKKAEKTLQTLKCGIYLRSLRTLFELSELASPVTVDCAITGRCIIKHPKHKQF